MNLGINNYQYGTNFGCNKIKLEKLDIHNKQKIIDSLKHEKPVHSTTSAADFYKNLGFQPHTTLPNGIKIYYPTSLKEMEEIIANDYKKSL